MADEVINIASFELDPARLEASLNTLQSRMFELKKEQEGYINQSKEVKKATEALVKEQLRLAASGQELSKEYADNNELLQDLSKSEQQLYKNQLNTASSMARVRTEVTATNKELNAYMTSQAKQTTLMDAGAKALQTQVTNINQARASNTELLRVRNQLNPAIEQEAALIKQLNDQLNKNNAFIKNNASEYEKQKIGIGDYASGIKEAFAELGGFNGSLGNTQQALKAITPLFASLKTEAALAFAEIKGGTVATEGLTTAEVVAATATNVFSGALKLLRIALISTGIGAIVVVLGSLIAYLTTTQDGIGKLTAITRPLQAVFQGLLGVLSNLGRALVETFENPKKALKDLGDFLKNNIINRFKAFSVILEGIRDLDFKKITNGALQAGTGVENLTDKIAAGAEKANKFLVEQAKLGAEVDRLTKEMEASQLAYNAAQVAVGDALDKNNLIIKDTSKSFKERAAAAQENIAIAEKNGQAEADILKLELERLKVQQQIKGIQNLTNADKQEEIDLLNKIDDAEDKGLEKRLEYSRVLAGLQKERQEAAKKENDEALKRAEAASDAAIKAMQDDLAIYIASQGDKKKSLSEFLKFNEEILKQELAINQASYEADEITFKEYQLGKLEIQNEFMAKQNDAVMANADIELELFRLNNQRKIDENQFYNEEIYRQELDRINRLAEEEANIRTQEFANGLISVEEYNLAVAQIDENQRIANEAAAQEREDAKKEKEAADLAIQSELDAEAFELSLQLQMAQYQREYEVEKAAAISNGADMIKFEQAQAKKKKDIETTVADNKLELASSTLGTISQLVGKETALGKAAAVAQTTIDTIRGAQSAFTGMIEAIPGPVGIALGAVAAAGALVTGYANVKKIVSVKTPSPSGGSDAPRPKYARGVIGMSGIGNGTSDSVTANLSAGESVITARATQMFPQLLSDINQAGGGVGLDGRTSNILQDNISRSADNSQMAQVIADAVRTGAAEGSAVGSQQGIRGAADDIKVMSDAKF